MGKRLSYKSKLNILLISYSFIVTMVVLILGFILINKLEIPMKNLTDSYFIGYTQKEITDTVIKHEGFTKPIQDSNKVVTAIELKESYSKILMKNGIVIMIFTFALVMTISVLISKLLSKKIIYPIEKITSSLPDIINNDEEINDDIFIGELSGIKSALEKSTYKIKLLLTEANHINSYITHEQKNTLALLRAKIQMGERDELISIVDKMSSSLDDILAINATENMECHEEIDLGVICAEATDVYRKVYKNIELQIDEEEIPMINGRELWIYRAVCNLIENAIKYGDNSSIIVKVYNKNGSAIICVEDMGKGIDKEIIDKIFNYKYRGENLKKDGHGIGLSLVAHITKLCNGTTFVESEKDKGTKFYMVFRALTID
ncbi:sensor histidine kinase [Clostridium sp. UBA6640]|uniref:sensor histidine kinase n=1 Tax=Clostridium sp. UBA6640 TaxID=1946370 RepID=UPI0025C4A4DD|nr:HAMP domain-containing sensor histidine kinase [Clostridium sp. UBA6640]